MRYTKLSTEFYEQNVSLGVSFPDNHNLLISKLRDSVGLTAHHMSALTTPQKPLLHVECLVALVYVKRIVRVTTQRIVTAMQSEWFWPPTVS